ncbi:endolytic transglycosylase MltG [Salibacterium salarium]|uniref:Endolytic murein transglycosylase n=1 Tax=Salibacterium salarium TaxID=284579 RepID=A0A3R9Q1E9_9BACI|nr:endolytic transglycosylase MltG [Salibacterium salarium]RSL31582.1 endolytic transglycosylase MltG [Salibacterium salarium]
MEDDPKKGPLMEKEKQAKVVRKIIFITLAILVVVIAAVSIGGYLYISSALEPADEQSDESINIEIPIGSNAAAIGEILEEEGVIKNGTIFQYYVRYNNESGFQAGEYELSPSMDIDQIIQELKEGIVEQEYAISFIIPEGTWYEDIVSTISEETQHEESEIRTQLQEEEYVEELIEQYNILTEDILADDIRYPLEGYLFPTKYNFLEEDVEITTIIERMIERTQENMVKFSEQVEENDYSIHEILALASIVEREAREQEDRPRIAGVLYNRLDEGMRLEVDPTVSYAVGEHNYMTSNEDLESESPYNTYRFEGFPPGPIASPGTPSVEAVLNPEESEDLYFYARHNGEVIYNETYEEHREVQEQYRSEWIEAQEE